MQSRTPPHKNRQRKGRSSVCFLCLKTVAPPHIISLSNEYQTLILLNYQSSPSKETEKERQQLSSHHAPAKSQTSAKVKRTEIFLVLCLKSETWESPSPITVNQSSSPINFQFYLLKATQPCFHLPISIGIFFISPLDQCSQISQRMSYSLTLPPSTSFFTMLRDTKMQCNHTLLSFKTPHVLPVSSRIISKNLSVLNLSKLFVVFLSY